MKKIIVLLCFIVFTFSSCAEPVTENIYDNDDIYKCLNCGEAFNITDTANCYLTELADGCYYCYDCCSKYHSNKCVLCENTFDFDNVIDLGEENYVCSFCINNGLYEEYVSVEDIRSLVEIIKEKEELARQEIYESDQEVASPQEVQSPPTNEVKTSISADDPRIKYVYAYPEKETPGIKIDSVKEQSENTESTKDSDYTDIDMFYVDSSAFSEVGYDTWTETLYVRFRNSGALYVYSDIPRSIYEDFIYADSLGGYYNEYIKGSYNSERIE